MLIQPVDPQDSHLLDRVVALHTATDAVDCPWQEGLTARSLRVFLTRGWDDQPDQMVVGTLDGEVVAAGSVTLPARENVHTAWLGARVHPDRRRNGFGTRIYDHLERLAADAGRSVFGTAGTDGAATRAFAASREYPQRSMGVIRRVDLLAVPAEQVEQAYQDALSRAGGYELVRVAGALSDDLLDAYVETVAAINDAPQDDMELEDEVHGPDRIRYYERTQELRGMRLYRVLVRYRQTGRIAGHTVVAVEGDRPHLAEQHDTTVVPTHRGHRLGLLVKADMMRWLREAEPWLRSITTQNAESNNHMIAVNDRLGYVTLGRVLFYQREVETS
ncbi:MAG: GNAT family N-acetyltransferase [Lapillicoccus sp.]